MRQTILFFSLVLFVPLADLAAKGMAIGTTIGASIGAFVGYGLSKAFDDAFDDGFDDGYEEGNSDRSAYLRNAAKGAFFIGLPGALIGAGIGASYRDEQWKKVQIDSIYMGIAPQRGGVQIAASFRF